MEKLNKRSTPVFYIAMLLLVLVLFSTRMTASLYARFTTTADGSDGARVATFNVDCQGTQGTPMAINLDFFDSTKRTDTIEFAVTSSSEVAVSYEISLILPEALTKLVKDEKIVVTLTEVGGATVKGTINTMTKQITFGNKNLAPTNGTVTINYTITFTIPEGSIPGEIVEITDPITLRVHAEQID